MNTLFLCVANSARSQMAEGYARHVFGDRAKIQSAGSMPTQIHPLAIQVMNEIGIDISSQVSKAVSSIDLPSVQRVITLCAEEVCPVFAGNVQRLHWPLPDPAASTNSPTDSLQNFRSVRNELIRRIDTLPGVQNDLTDQTQAAGTASERTPRSA
jgi:arsenate reductase